jgi:hypothetical protein
VYCDIKSYVSVKCHVILKMLIKRNVLFNWYHNTPVGENGVDV